MLPALTPPGTYSSSRRCGFQGKNGRWTSLTKPVRKTDQAALSLLSLSLFQLVGRARFIYKISRRGVASPGITPPVRIAPHRTTIAPLPPVNQTREIHQVTIKQTKNTRKCLLGISTRWSSRRANRPFLLYLVLSHCGLLVEPCGVVGPTRSRGQCGLR